MSAVIPPHGNSTLVDGSPQLSLPVRFSRLSVFLQSGLLLMCVLGGCAQFNTWLHDPFDAEAKQAEEIRYRQEFLVSRSPEALRWLVSHRLKNGMSKAQVDEVIGESGEREFRDKAILGDGGPYRSDDVVYRWGPDAENNTYLFVFRDDALLNVDKFARDLNEMKSTRIGFELSSDDF